MLKSLDKRAQMMQREKEMCHKNMSNGFGSSFLLFFTIHFSMSPTNV